ncbi:hypothetical protein C8A01DRAFT_16203 [Parachaetomium inaequale]|uniref:F-box domain-containing protein n=1 Tax=Parachaetomium inaequale TaxID=2588326 RepID=A0AAN6PFD1_9PEZI|nr:hypothetical protein C8A01DRAFT_16203 [Parachaetomium inaequale]
MGLGILPGELVEAVVTALCVYCSPGEGRCCLNSNCTCLDGDPTDRSRISALASLCLTSRKLNAAATRHLYHVLPSRKWSLLARTLLARKDLARLAKALRVGFCFSADGSHSSPELDSYFSEQLGAYLDSLSSDKRTQIRQRLPRENLFPESNNAALDIMVSLCPNLETLEAILEYLEVFRFCPPNSMPRLQTVVLSHGDTEGGIHLRNLEPLFLAAPNITSLTLYMVDERGGIQATLEKLTHLDFQCSAFDAATLASVLAACPSLESLKYETGGPTVGYNEFTLPEARDAVLAHAAPSLKLFRLSAGDNDMRDEGWYERDLPEMERVLVGRGIRFEFCPRKGDGSV